MNLSRPLLVRLVLYSVLLVMALMIRHRLQNRPPAPPAAPTTFEVTIEDGATIDFSKGGPEVRATPEDKAALEAAAKEMTEAAKDTTFSPKN